MTAAQMTAVDLSACSAGSLSRGEGRARAGPPGRNCLQLLRSPAAAADQEAVAASQTKKKTIYSREK